MRINFDYRAPAGSKPQVPVILRPTAAMMRQAQQNSIDEGKIIKEREKLIDAMLVKLLKHANSTRGNSITFN